MVTFEHKKKTRAFAKRWKGRGYEKGDTAQFWIELLGLLDYEVEGTSPFEYHLANGGFIDVWLHDAGVLVEQKALGVDLDKRELRQGQLRTPLEQALHYADDLPLSTQPRWIVTCNFSSFRVYDRDAHSKSELATNGFEFSLDDFGEHPEYLAFITDSKNARQEKELQVSIRAGELVGQLYDRLRKCYLDPSSEETMHALNVLCVRTVFCLFCEDSDLFEKDAFYRYLRDVPAPYLRDALIKLFRALDTPLAKRDPYDTTVQGFPYVNGGLFREEVQVPTIDNDTKVFLLEEMSAAVNWSEISPTIFGGIFEGTLNPVTRRQGGMHYTSPENIHKVIDPLFLDDLKNEFTSIQANADLTPRQKKNRYAKLHQRICGLKFFDPACGSGNFLTETYLSLRKLEDALLHELRGGQMGFGLEVDEQSGVRVSLNQFYGIEINDFAVTVAEAALWISRLKANGQTMMLLDMDADDFPLSESAHIVHENALRIDWNDVLPASECSFIMGNPPFLGNSHLLEEQDADRAALFGRVRTVDYVACWYVKASDYTKDCNIRCAFVSTNSICQGQQVKPLWGRMFDEGNHIDFAYRTFIWNSEAADQAHVHCVIVGFSRIGTGKRRLFSEEGVPSLVDNINGYLENKWNVELTRHNAPLCDVLPMVAGGKPSDGGNLILSPKERVDLLSVCPDAKEWIRPYSMGSEFINGIDRYCLWLVGITKDELENMPPVSERVRRVRMMRLASKKEATQKKAATPWLFDEVKPPQSDNYIAVPKVSSGRRAYIPMGFVTNGMIPGDKLFFISDGGLYEFGILESQIHNAWVRSVAGRLKSDYSYSNTIVYNNFVWPENAADAQKAAVERAAQAVLDARANHPDDSLAKLYDPDLMPADLCKAHAELDSAVEIAYHVDFRGDEEKIVAHLFKLYAEKVKA